jgi:hypothetical protein
MTRTRQVLTVGVMMAGLTGVGRPAFASEADQTSSYRVRTHYAAIATLIEHASEQSNTFRSVIETAPDPPTLVIHVEDRAHVLASQMAGAQKETIRIFAEAGVRAIWVEGVIAPRTGSDGVTHVTVVLLDARGTENMVAEDKRLGIGAGGQAFRGGSRAYIFYPRVAYVARLRNRDIGTIVGMTIAHEVGHLLLPTESHSPLGIMRAELDLESMSPQGFTRTQCDAIRRRLQPAPTIMLHVDDHAQLPANERATAREQAVSILSDAAVRAIWSDGASAGGAIDGVMHINVVILDDRATDQMVSHDDLGGTVVGQASRSASRAYIFYPRIAFAAQRHQHDVGTVVGMAIAHEVGHILLPQQSHSNVGIMRADLDLNSVFFQGFTGAQREAIRSTLSAAQQ